MKRTNKQNNSMHKYLELVSDALNSAGYDMKRTLKHDVDIPWNRDMAKDFLWRPIQNAMTGKESTADLTTTEEYDVYLVLSRYLAEKFGIHVDWPSNK